MKKMFFLLFSASCMMAMELPKESQAIGLASSLAGTYLLLKAAEAEIESRIRPLGPNEYKKICFKRDLYLGAGGSLKLSSLLILGPHVAKCRNPQKTWVAIEACSLSISCGIIAFEQAYKDHKVPWRKRNRDLNLAIGVSFLNLGGLIAEVYCTDEEI